MMARFKALVTSVFVLTLAALACHTRADDVNSRITGTVRDLSGAPTARVHVAFYPGFNHELALFSEVETDANGRYEIFVQKKKKGNIFWGHVNLTNSIMARDFERNLAAIQEFVGTTTNIDLTLEPGITLTGSVRNTDGAPVNDAELEFRFPSGDSLPKLDAAAGLSFLPDGVVDHAGPRSARVDALGSFSIPALPQGRQYSIWEVTAKGYGSAHLHVDAKNTRTNSYEFPAIVLKRADHALAGQVVGADGKPLAGVQIRFSGPGQPQNSNTNTDTEGRFAFDRVSDGPLKLFAHYSDPLDRSIYMSLNGGGGIDVRAGDTNILIRLRDTSISGWDVPTLVTTGTVFDPSGNPARGVSLAVWHSANPFKTFTSDQNGKFQVRWQRPLGVPTNWPAAKVKSVLLARDHTHNLTTSQELDESAANLDLHLQPGCTLSGSVHGASGEPVTNAVVSLKLSLNARAELAKAEVDTNGSFSFSTLPHEGEYTVEVKAAPYARATATVTYDSTSYSLQLPPFKLTLPNLQLAGTVVGPDDRPIPGIRVDALGASQLLIAHTVTDGEGHFVFEKVAEGSIRIFVDNNSALEAHGGDRNVILKLRR